MYFLLGYLAALALLVFWIDRRLSEAHYARLRQFYATFPPARSAAPRDSLRDAPPPGHLLRGDFSGLSR